VAQTDTAGPGPARRTAIADSPRLEGIRQFADSPQMEGMLQAADSLYRQGHYFEASIAYERLLFEHDDRQAQLPAIFGKVRCLKKQQLYDQVVSFLDAYLTFPFSDSGLAQIQYEQALCTYLGGHFENTISLVDRWPFTHAGKAPPPLLSVLKILSLNELQRWTEAATAYRAFLAQRGVEAGNAVQPGQIPDLYAQLPHFKSVTKAQWLSTFIPGGGQFYAGRPGEALFSILVQAAGAWFAVVSFQQHYYVSAWLVGAALFGAFHMGGVRRSEVLVRQYNRKRMLAFNAGVREQLLQLIE